MAEELVVKRPVDSWDEKIISLKEEIKTNLELANFQFNHFVLFKEDFDKNVTPTRRRKYWEVQIFHAKNGENLCKTDRGLNRHQLNKHNRATSDSDLDNQIAIHKDVFLELVKQSQDKIYGDENYPVKFRSVIKNFQFIDGECGRLWGEIVNTTHKKRRKTMASYFTSCTLAVL